MGTLIGAAVLAVLANGLTILQMPRLYAEHHYRRYHYTCCCDPEDREKCRKKTIPTWT